MLSIHLSYRPPSYWRIFFCSVGYPRHFSHLKKFRAVPVRGFRKGIILQGRQLPSGLPVIGYSWMRRKGYVTVASVHAPRYRISIYVQTVRRSNIRDQTTRTPSLANPPIQTTPQVPPFTAPLHPGKDDKFSFRSIRDATKHLTVRMRVFSFHGALCYSVFTENW